MQKPHDQLTDADLALLEHLASGDCYKEIAFARGVSDAAIRMQMGNVVKILGAKNRIHAIALYVEKHRKP